MDLELRDPSGNKLLVGPSFVIPQASKTLCSLSFV